MNPFLDLRPLRQAENNSIRIFHCQIAQITDTCRNRRIKNRLSFACGLVCSISSFVSLIDLGFCGFQKVGRISEMSASLLQAFLYLRAHQRYLPRLALRVQNFDGFLDRLHSGQRISAHKVVVQCGHR